MFFREEAQELIDIGALNGLFVLGRSMGFIGKKNMNISSVTPPLPQPLSYDLI